MIFFLRALSGPLKPSKKGFSSCIGLPKWPLDQPLRFYAGSRLNRTEPEAFVFFQEFLPGHVVRAVAGEGEADFTVEDVDGG